MQVASLAGNRDLEIRGDIRIGYGMISLTHGVGTDPGGLRNSVEPSPEKCLPRGEGGGVVIPWSYLPLVEGCSWALSPPALQPALHVG